jgi:uncharacterized membrane protein required for colicin V production
MYRPVAAYGKFLHLPGSVLSVISFMAVFLACMLAIILLGFFIKKIVHLTVLGWVDRLCGGMLGFVKVFFLVWIIVMAIASLPFEGIKNWFKPARTYSMFVSISPKLRAEGLMPSAGPVQNILKANPIPAIEGAIKNVASAADSVFQKTHHEPVAATKKPAGASPAAK